MSFSGRLGTPTLHRPTSGSGERGDVNTGTVQRRECRAASPRQGGCYAGAPTSETAVASTATRTRSARSAGAAAALRTATHPAHRAVESLPLMRALMSADIDPSTYTDVLRRQWRIHAGWEQANADWLRAQAWTYRPRAPALQADLDWLQAGAPDGAPMPAHLGLPVDWPDFARWLALFEDTALRVCPPEGAALLVDRAHRIARNLHAAIGRAD